MESASCEAEPSKLTVRGLSPWLVLPFRTATGSVFGKHRFVARRTYEPAPVLSGMVSLVPPDGEPRRTLPRMLSMESPGPGLLTIDFGNTRVIVPSAW